MVGSFLPDSAHCIFHFLPFMLTNTLTTVWSMTVGIALNEGAIAGAVADDAQALHEWLTQQANVSADRALLLTRRSSSFYQRSTQPDRSTLSYWIEQLRTHGIQTGDTLWLFWSGPGMRRAGDDYLLPLDTDLSQPLLKGIKVRSLFKALKSLPTDRIVVFLDIQCKSEDDAHPWGKQTQQLAQQFGLTTVLLAQPDRRSSSPGLSQGLFTAALLDTFRSHSTYQGLPEFLQRFSKHLPSRCDSIDRPLSLQIFIQPETTSIVIPQSRGSDGLTTGDLWRYARSPMMSAVPALPVCLKPTPPPKNEGFRNQVSQKLGVKRPSFPKPLIEFRLLMLTGLLSTFFLGFLSVWTARSLQSRTYAQKMVLPTPVLKPSLKPNPKNPPDRTLAALPVPEEPSGDSNRILEEARNYITPTDPDELLRAIDRISQIPPGDPGYGRAQKQIDRWSENLLRLSQLQANRGNWRTAIAIAGQVRSDRSALYATAQKSIREWTLRSRS